MLLLLDCYECWPAIYVFADQLPAYNGLTSKGIAAESSLRPKYSKRSDFQLVVFVGIDQRHERRVQLSGPSADTFIPMMVCNCLAEDGANLKIRDDLQ